MLLKEPHFGARNQVHLIMVTKIKLILSPEIKSLLETICEDVFRRFSQNLRDPNNGDAPIRRPPRILRQKLG
jgi:hypothetical protein